MISSSASLDRPLERKSRDVSSTLDSQIYGDRTSISFRHVWLPTFFGPETTGDRKFIQLPRIARNRKEGLEAKLIVSQPAIVGLARDFGESVAYSVGILCEQVANLFYYHAPAELQRRSKPAAARCRRVRSSTPKSPRKRSASCRKGMREKTLRFSA